ncbi:MAG: Rpn family recombination-promoting nuclease/putative transposase [Pseudomonadota bacterium]|nr:Rpn family recombination-promoting nuclease/putative transposase [Pseudomonadota bacterium]
MIEIDDQFFQNIMSDISLAQKFLSEILPLEILREIDLGTIEQLPQSFIESPSVLPTMDILYKINWLTRHGHMYLIIELLTEQDPEIQLRMMQYTNDVINQHMKNTQDMRNPFVFSFVFYHGEERFKRPVGIMNGIKRVLH